MNFYIKQHSDYPLIKFPLTQKLMEKYHITDEMMENVAVTFSMYNNDIQNYEIANSEGGLLYRENIDETPYQEKYTLYYQFNKNETSKIGYFSGEFKLILLNDENIITLPNNDVLNIFITESIVKVDLMDKDDLGKNKRWYGAYGDTEPETDTDIRTLTYTYDNKFILNTGTEKTVHVFAIPADKTLESVVDRDALSMDLTDEYILSEDITEVPNDKGKLIPYKVYIYTIDVPYSKNHRHVINII